MLTKTQQFLFIQNSTTATSDECSQTITHIHARRFNNDIMTLCICVFSLKLAQSMVQNLLLTNISHEQKQQAMRSVHGSDVTPGRSETPSSYSRRMQKHQRLAWGYKTGVCFIAWESMMGKRVWLRVPKLKWSQRHNSVLPLPLSL